MGRVFPQWAVEQPSAAVGLDFLAPERGSVCKLFCAKSRKPGWATGGGLGQRLQPALVSDGEALSVSSCSMTSQDYAKHAGAWRA